MRSPMTLTFRHTDHSSALEARARELGQRLQRYGERITQCHMTVEGSRGGHSTLDGMQITQVLRRDSRGLEYQFGFVLGCIDRQLRDGLG
jgi:hypothetical protein